MTVTAAPAGDLAVSPATALDASGPIRRAIHARGPHLHALQYRRRRTQLDGQQDRALAHPLQRLRHTRPGAPGAWVQTSQADFATGTAASVSTSANPGSVVLATAGTWTENFDEPGAAWSSTIFSNVLLGAGHFDRDVLAAGSGVPSTTPALPINVGGDLEGRFLPTISGGVSGRVQMPSNSGTILQDGTMDGYIGIGYLSTFGSQTAMFCLRASADGQNSYAATIGRNSATTGYVAIQKWAGGISGVALASVTFAADYANEIYRLHFTAQGSALTASVWRVTASGGVVVETPIPLTGSTNTISATETTYTSGVAGFYCFCAQPNRLLFGDITITGNTAAYGSAGTLISPAINPNPWARWRQLSFTRDISATGTALTVDVLDAGGSLLAANVASGTDLDSLPSVASQPAIRVRANLSTSNSANTPRLDDWSVDYFASATQTYPGLWSSAVASTQDATAPALTLTLPAATGTVLHTLTGTAADAAGVSGLTVNGVAVASGDGFAHWSLPVTLTLGANTFSIVARDNANPANVRTISHTVTVSLPPPAMPMATACPMRGKRSTGSAPPMQPARTAPSATPTAMAASPSSNSRSAPTPCCPTAAAAPRPRSCPMPATDRPISPGNTAASSRPARSATSSKPAPISASGIPAPRGSRKSARPRRIPTASPKP